MISMFVFMIQTTLIILNILKKKDYNFKLKKIILWSPLTKQKPKGIKITHSEQEEEATVFGTRI